MDVLQQDVSESLLQWFPALWEAGSHLQVFSKISILSGAIHDHPNPAESNPIHKVSLGYTKSILEMFQSYSSTTKNKTLLEYAVNLVSYLLPLGEDESP